MKPKQRKPQRSEIEQMQMFARAISQMTPEQMSALKALMEDLAEGRPTELSLARYRKAVNS